jgi:hypothetical protein
MSLIIEKSGVYIHTDWVNNFTEIEERLTNAQNSANGAVADIFTGASDADMTTHTAAKKGWFCKRTDGIDPKKLYMLTDADYTNLSNWQFVAIWSLPDFNAAITAAINALLDGAPSALNTLKELADAINDDASFAASVTTALAAKANSSDVTTALALKLDISATSAWQKYAVTQSSGNAVTTPIVNFNDPIDPKEYQIDDVSMVTNKPSSIADSVAGLFTEKHIAAGRFQTIFLVIGNCYKRAYDGTSWSSWTSY